MKADFNRLERWRSSAPGRIVEEIGQYFVFAVGRFYRDNGMQSAAALTYTTLLAIVPLLAIAFSIFSAFPAFVSVRVELEQVIFDNLVPEVGGVVREYLQSFLTNTGSLGTVGVVALGVSAVLLLATIETTLNTIWRVERQRPLVFRILMSWAMITLGPLLLGASMSLTTDAFSVVTQLWSEAGLSEEALRGDNPVRDRILAATLQTIAFTILFLVVPNRTVTLRDAFIGGAISGIAFEFLKAGFAWYLTSFPTYQTIYGAMAVIPIFLIWLYLSWTVVILGAVFSSSFPEWWRARTPRLEDTDVSPLVRFNAALAVISMLVDKQATGQPIDETELDALTLPSDPVDQVLERLLQSHWISATDDGRFVLSRDPGRSTGLELFRDLGLSAGGEEGRPPAASAGLVRDIGEEILKAERAALDRPVADFLQQTETSGSDGAEDSRGPLRAVGNAAGD
jgi:membrane protein